MTDPERLEPDRSELAAAEGNLATVTDDEWYEALDRCPPGTDDAGNTYSPRQYVYYARSVPPDERQPIIDRLNEHVARGTPQ